MNITNFIKGVPKMEKPAETCMPPPDTKVWKELSEEEKIERLRDIYRRQQQQIDNLWSGIWRLEGDAKAKTGNTFI